MRVPGDRLRRNLRDSDVDVGLLAVERGFVSEDALMQWLRERETGNAAPLLEPAAPGADPGELLDRAWGRQMIAEAVAELRTRLAAEGREAEADLFEAYDLDERQTAAIRELAPRFGLTEARAWKALTAVRRTLRSILLERARDYVGDEEHLFQELDEILGRVRP